MRFEALLNEEYAKEFQEVDKGGAGSISVDQVERLLLRIGQCVRRFVLDELVEEVDNNGLVDLSRSAEPLK